MIADHAFASIDDLRIEIDLEEILRGRLAMYSSTSSRVRSHAVGYAFFVDGERNTADVYGSAQLFRKLWPKLLDVAILEALSSTGQKVRHRAATVRSVRSWLRDAEAAELHQERDLPPRARVVTKTGDKDAVFETFDTADQGGPLHTNAVAR